LPGMSADNVQKALIYELRRIASSQGYVKAHFKSLPSAEERKEAVAALVLLLDKYMVGFILEKKRWGSSRYKYKPVVYVNSRDLRVTLDKCIQDVSWAVQEARNIRKPVTVTVRQ